MEAKALIVGMGTGQMKINNGACICPRRSWNRKLKNSDLGKQQRQHSKRIYGGHGKFTCHQFLPSVTSTIKRRTLGFGAILLLYRTYPVLADMNASAIGSLKLKDGIKFQDIVEGEGPEAREGDLVEINYVCRRSNGYFVHSTVDQFSGESNPVILSLDEKQIIKGLKDVLIGMKAGGKRRALIPPELGYANKKLEPIPMEYGPRRSLLSHANEPLVFEVQVLKLLRQ